MNVDFWNSKSLFISEEILAIRTDPNSYPKDTKIEIIFKFEIGDDRSTIEKYPIFSRVKKRG